MEADPPSRRMASVLSTIATQARRTNLVRAAEIGTALDRASVGQLDAAGRAAAERIAHQLAGSAGTFGFVEVSRLARLLERFFVETAGSAAPDPERLIEARSLLVEAADRLAGEPDLA
jgi:HPt (histidine-containing phosphotransfer) domain-containing protein